MRIPTKAWLSAALAACAMSAQAAVVFSDDFEANSTGLNVVPSGWTVQNGTVDIVSGGFCLNASTRCIDLDGSTGDAGVLANSFSAVAGTSYLFSYQLSGNRRGGANDTVTVDIGGTSQQHVLAPLDGLQTFSLQFLAGSTGTVAFSFANAGGDNVGAILDTVSVISQVNGEAPEPTALALLAGGALAWGWARRRTMRR